MVESTLTSSLLFSGFLKQVFLGSLSLRKRVTLLIHVPRGLKPGTSRGGARGGQPYLGLTCIWEDAAKARGFPSLTNKKYCIVFNILLCIALCNILLCCIIFKDKIVAEPGKISTQCCRVGPKIKGSAAAVAYFHSFARNQPHFQYFLGL